MPEKKMLIPENNMLIRIRPVNNKTTEYFLWDQETQQYDRIDTEAAMYLMRQKNAMIQVAYTDIVNQKDYASDVSPLHIDPD